MAPALPMSKPRDLETFPQICVTCFVGSITVVRMGLEPELSCTLWLAVLAIWSALIVDDNKARGIVKQT